MIREAFGAGWIVNGELLAQAVALAYICDHTLVEAVLRRHGVTWSDAGLMTASLHHAMWFHADGRADESDHDTGHPRR